MADLQWFKAQLIWGAALENLSDDEAGRFAKAVWKFATTGKAVLPDGYAGILFSMAAAQMQKDAEDRAAFLIRQAENGRKGGRPMKTGAEAEAEQPLPMADRDTSFPGGEIAADVIGMKASDVMAKEAEAEQPLPMADRDTSSPAGGIEADATRAKASTVMAKEAEAEQPLPMADRDTSSPGGGIAADVIGAKASAVMTKETEAEQPLPMADRDTSSPGGGIAADVISVKASAVMTAETKAFSAVGDVCDDIVKEAAQKNPGLFIKTQKTQA